MSSSTIPTNQNPLNHETEKNRMIVRPTLFCALTLILPSATNSSLAQISGIPTLDDLAGSWQKASELRSLPAVNSILFADGVLTTPLFSEHTKASHGTKSGMFGEVA